MAELIRKFLQQDKEKLKDLLSNTLVFTKDEINVALELVDIYLHNQQQKDYDIYSAIDDNENLLGYICIGPTPLTNGTYDLYWIAVSSNHQGKGIGKKLLDFAERKVKENNGRLIVIETSSQEKYKKTTRFYENAGYKLLTRIKDYYNIGDDLLVYGKYLSDNVKIKTMEEKQV